MKYYLHDANSFDDEKITELYLNFGYEGLGLFYTALEKMAKQEKPIKTSVLKAQLKVGKRLNKCWDFMEEIGIISSNNGETFNKQLLNFSEMYQIKKEKTRKKVSEWREKQDNKESVTNYVPVSNSRKVKESKVKESKENIKKQFTPPLLLEVESYFIENGYSKVSAIKAFNHYDLANWHDTNGKPVFNWRQKIHTNWFKPENKDSDIKVRIPPPIPVQNGK